LDGTGGNPRGTNALRLEAGITNATVRNNILVNTYRRTAGGASTALWVDPATTFSTNYNDLYVDTSFANSYVGYRNIGYRTLGAWQGAGFDQNSLSVQPIFRIPNLHLDTTSIASRQLNARATPLVGITTDVDGEQRHAATPDIGADEMWLVIDGVGDDVAAVPERFALGQNYPNPFNPETEIGFRIAEVGFVSLKVFDVLGREVATLVNEEKQLGTYSVQWDASGQASGVYFYRLQTGNFVDVKKLILLR
jgi:hypothetical protein